MTEEINNITAILHTLQNKVDRLEIANRELEEKLHRQNETNERLLTNLHFQNSNAIVPITDQEQEELLLQKDDSEKISFSHKSESNTNNNKDLTIEKSIHNLPLFNILGKFSHNTIKKSSLLPIRHLGIIFPVISAIAFVADAILFLISHNPKNDKHKNYAGLLSTVLILFYYLQYDVNFNFTHPRLYICYQFVLWILMFSGNIINVYYYQQLLNRPFMTYIFVCYAIIDTVWIFLIGYFKFKGYRQHMFIITIENLFHLMAMVGQLLIIFIPIFGAHEVITTKTIAFIVLYEVFSQSYTDMLDLKYSKLTCLCLWFMIIFSTLSIGFEYFVYALEQMIEEKNKNDNNNYLDNESSFLSSNSEYKDAIRYFIVAREITELISTIACYLLLLLQFFIKKERKNK